ncbi:hypothetical protein HNR23_001997 [Nocardiopsis mwathae]|uniref:Uncharacterized protein n=1 Tax=Nocardiopsis mwathae TaxID=1472723 RepID=A0A7W9YGX7_9ACTN|nr:hypothetical protein [Nocardiopsis mwathae]MBB6171937.1 hypothetical protein [Nocardiopsis mwathae]
MAHTTHANAKLAPAGRLALARCIVEDGWPLSQAGDSGRPRHSAVRYRFPAAASSPF